MTLTLQAAVDDATSTMVQDETEEGVATAIEVTACKMTRESIGVVIRVMLWEATGVSIWEATWATSAATLEATKWP